MNLALIYNSDVRNNGSPVHIWHGFKQIGAEFTRYTPKGRLPKHDFYLCLDDGRDDICWVPPHPCGFWAVDTHLCWDFRFAKAKEFDIVWCAQKPAAEKMKAEGLNAYWLPLACNPVAHPTQMELLMRNRPGSVVSDYAARSLELTPPKFDIGFVGHLQPPAESDRVEFLDALFRAFPNFRLAFGVFHEDMARMYHQCRIGVNHAVRDDLNMRFFELASIGVPQLCDQRMQGLEELGFINHAHYFGYSSTEEAIEKVTEYLSKEYARNVTSRMAHEHVRKHHTYEHRARKILEAIDDLLPASDRSPHTAERSHSELLV